MSKEYLSDAVWYGEAKGTIAFDVPGITLPPGDIEVDGKALLPKNEFHGSFIAARKYAERQTSDITEAKQLEAEIVSVAREQLNKQPLEFIGFTGEYYLCEEGDEVTIIGLVKINGVDELVRTVSQVIDIPIDSPLLHITVYKNQESPYGIGIRNDEEFAALCRELPGETLSLLRSAIPTVKA